MPLTCACESFPPEIEVRTAAKKATRQPSERRNIAIAELLQKLGLMSKPQALSCKTQSFAREKSFFINRGCKTARPNMNARCL